MVNNKKPLLKNMDGLYTKLVNSTRSAKVVRKFPAVNGSQFGPNTSMRFEIPPDAGVLVSSDCYMEFNVTMPTAGAYLRPSPSFLGAHVLIKQVTIRAGDGTVLEEIPEYNTWVGCKMSTSNDLDRETLVALVEGCPLERLGTELQRYDPRWLETTPFKVCLPLHGSGLLGRALALPIKALGGITLEIELDSNNVLQSRTPIAGGAGEPGAAQDFPAAPQDFVDMTNISSFVQNGELRDNGTRGYFFIGQPVVLSATVAAAPATSDQTITALSIVGNRLRLTLDPGNPWAGAAATAVSVSTRADPAPAAVQPYVVSAPSFVVGARDYPDDASLDFELDFVSVVDMRGNISAGAFQASENIDPQTTRSLAILSVPMVAGTRNPAEPYNGRPNTIQSYRFQLFGKPVPSRNVSTAQWDKIDAEHITELVKALESGRLAPTDMSRRQWFMIGRSLASGGFTTDMTRAGAQLQLTLNGAAAVAATIHNFVVHFRKLVVKNGVVSITY